MVEIKMVDSNVNKLNIPRDTENTKTQFYVIIKFKSFYTPPHEENKIL